MATVVFDFDSTVIECESLEELLKTKIKDPQIIGKIEEITSLGMSGEISFLTSIQSRLSMATLTKDDVFLFTKNIEGLLTPGIKELIYQLNLQGHDIWIVSGAIKDLLIPIGKTLDIPEDHLLGIELSWSANGVYRGIDATLPINRSKWEGAKAYADQWRSPKIAIGDGITDYALYEHGLVDHFIAFTQNVRREKVLEKGVKEAKSIRELIQCLNILIPSIK